MKELKWFDHPRGLKRLLIIFYVVLAFLIVMDPFIEKEHIYFPWEGVPGFFGAYGFVSCVGLIFIAKILRYFIKRNEAYYHLPKH